VCVCVRVCVCALSDKVLEPEENSNIHIRGDAYVQIDGFRGYVYIHTYIYMSVNILYTRVYICINVHFK